MSDEYKYLELSLSSPAVGGFDVVPNDAADMAKVVRGLYVGTGGSVKISTSDGSTLTFTNVPNASVLAIRASRVFATGTTASTIIGLI